MSVGTVITGGFGSTEGSPSLVIESGFGFVVASMIPAILCSEWPLPRPEPIKHTVMVIP